MIEHVDTREQAHNGRRARRARLITVIGRLIASVVIVAAAAAVGARLADIRSALPAVPGGGGPLVEPRDALVFLEPDRSAFSVRDLQGDIVSVQAVHGTVRSHAMDASGDLVAAWIEAPDGTFELTLWDVRAKSVRTLLRTREWPVGSPVWRSNASEVAVGVAEVALGTADPDAAPVSSRVLVVPLTGGTPLEIERSRGRMPITPLAITDQVLAGVREGREQRYVVIDRAHGTLDEEAAPGLQGFRADPRSGFAFATTHGSPATRSETLRIWRIEDFNAGVLTVTAPTVNAPLAWADRSWVVFGTGTTLRAVDARSGAARDLLIEDAIVMPVTFSANADRLLVTRVVAPTLKAYELSSGSVPASPTVIAPVNYAAVVGWTRI